MSFIYRYPLVLLLLTFSVEVFARAGGGGSRSSGNGSGYGSVAAGLLYAIYRIRRARMVIQAKKQFAAANAEDPSWDIDHFKDTASDLFYAYQEAWMNKDLSTVAAGFHPAYLKKAQAIMDTQLKGKKNIIENVELQNIELMSVLDIEGQDGDMFVLELKFRLIDFTINEKTAEFVTSPSPRRNKESYTKWVMRVQVEPHKVTEYWVFYRQDGKWLMYNIHQIDSFFGELQHASIKKLREILAKEKAKAKDAPVDDSFFYKKVD